VAAIDLVRTERETFLSQSPMSGLAGSAALIRASSFNDGLYGTQAINLLGLLIARSDLHSDRSNQGRIQNQSLKEEHRDFNTKLRNAHHCLYTE
jgi:hypothetical protein